MKEFYVFNSNVKNTFNFIKNHSLQQNWNAVKYKISKHTGLYRNTQIKYEPLRVVAVITYRCNLRCNFCEVFDLEQKVDEKYHDMSTSLYQEILNKFRGAFILGLGGGEPFLHKDIFKMIKYGRKFKMSVALDTNGILISNKIDQIISAAPSFLSISLNAYNEIGYQKINNAPSGIFDEVLQTIMKLVDKRNKENKKIQLGISYVCTTKNYREIPDMVKLGQELKVDSIYFINLLPIPKEGFTKDYCLYDDEKGVSEVIESLDRSQLNIEVTGPNLYAKKSIKRQLCCSQPITWLTVHPNGTVFTCCRGKVKAGNLLRNHNVWNNYIFQNFRKKMTSGDPLIIPNFCKTCPSYFARAR